MPINYTFYVGVAVFAMFFGYFFGLFEGRSQGYKKRKKEEEEQEAALEAQAAGPLPVPPPMEPPPAPPPPSLLRLSRDEAGQLRLDLDDQRVNTAALTGEERKRLIELLTLMRPWLEAAKPSPAPKPVSSPQRGSASQAVSASQPVPEPPAAAVPPANKPAARPLVAGPIVPIEPPDEAPASMVAQIDAILQARLIGTPLENQGIKLRESPEGSVFVHVGSKIYQAVEDIPDEVIKAAIRAAIATWEKKFTPGL